MQRILHILPTLDLSGTGKQLLTLARGLAREQYEVHLCALTRGGPLLAEFQEAEIPTKVIDRRWQADPLAYAKLKRHIAYVRPDVVHTWGFNAGVYGRMAARAAGVTCWIADMQSIDPSKAFWQWKIDRRLARSTDQFITISPAARDFCVAQGLPVERFTIIPRGVSSARKSDWSRAELLQKLHLPEDARLLGVLGKLGPSKRVKDLIWAADLLRVLHDNMRLLILGEGPEREQLERFARLASDLNHIRFLGERTDAWRIMPHLDVFWNGSDYEGQSNAVMEAMAAGLPVVATDIPGNRELVLPNETGFLVPVAGRAARARTTDQLLSDPELAQRMGENGRRRRTEAFSAEQMVDRYDRMYARICQDVF